MGRIFEVRKQKIFARMDRMAKQFTRIGKEIVIAVKSGGPDPNTNSLLRRVMANAKSINMPKDRVENAIKRAMGKDAESFEEVLFEGYAPHGVPVLVETATDNNTRTVANIRAIFNKWGGNLGTNGSVSFMFKHMGVFKLRPEGLNTEELELELIDYGLEDLGEGAGESDEPVLVIHCGFTDFGNMQKALEERKLEVISAEAEWIPTVLSTITEEDKLEDVLKLIGKLEDDDDVQKVYHNLS